MGNRIGIRFVNEEEVSPCLFSHYDGRALIEACKRFIDYVDIHCPQENVYPLSRREPRIAMIAFISWLTRDMELVVNNYYIGMHALDGDASDNGVWEINLNTRQITPWEYNNEEQNHKVFPSSY